MVICKFNLKLYGDSCKFKGPCDKTLDFAATPFEVESGLFPFKIPQSLSLTFQLNPLNVQNSATLWDGIDLGLDFCFSCYLL